MEGEGAWAQVRAEGLPDHQVVSLGAAPAVEGGSQARALAQGWGRQAGTKAPSSWRLPPSAIGHRHVSPGARSPQSISLGHKGRRAQSPANLACWHGRAGAGGSRLQWRALGTELKEPHTTPQGGEPLAEQGTRQGEV